MQVILLERVESLGQMGDVVNVKPGYARNYLLPRQKALRATKDNVAFFDTQKKILEADSLKKKGEAEKVAKKADGLKAVIIRQASEAGQLYGSVSARDISDAVNEQGVKITREQVRMDRSYKALGLFPVKIVLHPEVSVEITINIARSAEEAKLQEEKGGALIIDNTDGEEDARKQSLRDKAIKALEAQEKAAAEAAAAEAAAGAEGKKEEAAA